LQAEPVFRGVFPSSDLVEMPAQPKDPQAWLLRFLSDRHLRVCLLISLFVAAMPPDGVSWLDLCVVKNCTHSPCPGCGITRCGSNLLRGNWWRAACYHPFGLLFLPLIFAMGVLAVLPASPPPASSSVMATSS
jgi:hypothetical protein